LGIDPSHIDARGRGSTKCVVRRARVGQERPRRIGRRVEMRTRKRRVEVTIQTNPPVRVAANQFLITCVWSVGFARVITNLIKKSKIRKLACSRQSLD